MARLTGLEIALPEHYEHHTDNNKPEFLSKFPLGKVPAFETADGFKLVEGIPVARFGTFSPDHFEIDVLEADGTAICSCRNCAQQHTPWRFQGRRCSD